MPELQRQTRSRILRGLTEHIKEKILARLPKLFFREGRREVQKGDVLYMKNMICRACGESVETKKIAEHVRDKHFTESEKCQS